MKRPQSGFTLVELLVVITIIGILMGLLIPAVNAARETARRNQCGVNVKNLALAAVQYENSKGRLPPYVSKFGLYSGATDPSDPSNTPVARHVKIGTWGVSLTPYLDAQSTFEHWTQDRYPVITSTSVTPDLGSTTGASGTGFHTLAAANLAIFQCPSNPVSGGSHAQNSYIYNNGMCHVTPTGTAITGITFANSQDNANGVGNSAYNVTSVSPVTHTAEGPGVTLDDLKDGQGNTVLFTENIQALPWHRAGLINGPDLNTAAATDTDIVFTVESARYIHGMVWHYEDADYAKPGMAALWNTNGTAAAVVPAAVADFHKINGGGLTVSDDIFTKVITTIEDARNLARPSSAHVEGVNAGMADGGTRFINANIDYRVYQAMMTPRGKSSNVPWPEFTLTDQLD
jgi:prepilin-type N-terminal cleavage/methylation domain-containing protein